MSPSTGEVAAIDIWRTASRVCVHVPLCIVCGIALVLAYLVFMLLYGLSQHGPI